MYRHADAARVNEFALRASSQGIVLRNVIESSNAKSGPHIHDAGIPADRHCNPTLPGRPSTYSCVEPVRTICTLNALVSGPFCRGCLEFAVRPGSRHSAGRLIAHRDETGRAPLCFPLGQRIWLRLQPATLTMLPRYWSVIVAPQCHRKVVARAIAPYRRSQESGSAHPVPPSAILLCLPSNAQILINGSHGARDWG